MYGPVRRILLYRIFWSLFFAAAVFSEGESGCKWSVLRKSLICLYRTHKKTGHILATEKSAIFRFVTGV